jgi:hypothetical protein
MALAHELAKRCLQNYSCKFSRKDFTLPQLFACLVVREHLNKSYRSVEAVLRDSPEWCTHIGMKRVPDHNTLCRAFKVILKQTHIRRLLDLLAQWTIMEQTPAKTCAIDSTLYDTHHRSRHYEQRCRHYSSRNERTANSRRSRSARRTPKLALSVDVRTHVVVAARARTGMGSDVLDLLPLLRQSKRRRPLMDTVLADAGYDSHRNHEVAWTKLKVRSLIRAANGRPTARPPASRYRRMMRKKLNGSQKGKPYAQRAQAETVNSMMKRNLGDHLRARSPKARRQEQMLRVITHNLMVVLSRMDEG